MKKKFTRILLLSGITVLLVSSLFGKTPYGKVMDFFHRLNHDPSGKEKAPAGAGHDPVSRWHVSPQAEGRIGTTAESPVDDPTDNVFHVWLAEPVKAGEQVFLKYDLDGVEDHTAVARSINDELSVGGYFVKRRTGWAPQTEHLSAVWLKPGDNVIRFTLPEGANYSYRVRRVGLEVVPGTGATPAIVLDSAALHYYKDQVYIKGFVADAGHRSLRVTVDGVAARVWNGAFEAVVDSAGKNRQATIEVRYPGGAVQRRVVHFGAAIETDYRYALENNLARKQKLFSPLQGQILAMPGAAIAIGKGALRSPQSISMTALRHIDIPALDGGLINVTGAAAGYRFLPHGTRFAVPAQLGLDYDKARIPDGYTVKDIRTYFFDEQKRHWVALPRDSASKKKGRVYSRTLHFTDMINGVLKVPEAPDVEGFSPTTMKGIKAANPSAAVNLINPPQANSRGNASLGYSIEIPAGRAALQPNVTINYNSGGNNGWLGLGWDLSVSAITIDTRWGVPRFDGQNETETYSLNGAQLSPVAHRGDLVARTAEKQFHPRVEGAFNKIIRHGNSPQNYWWEVIDKQGTRNFYGGDPSIGADPQSTLSDASGNIAHWALRKTLDLHGNFVLYQYAQVQDPGVPGGNVGIQLYLSRISYTGYNGVEGKYTVQFLRDRDIDGHTSRKDISITANNGFKQVTADLLRRIDVQYAGASVRHYELTYKEGAFYKTLLTSINQYDAAGNFFNRHSFDYYDDVHAGTALAPLATPAGWAAGSDNVHGGMITHINGFTDEASALSGTANHDISGSMTVSVGFDPNVSTKLNSVGASFGYTQSQSQGMLAMVDINGDGLPDKLFLDGGTLYYRPNLSGTSGRTGYGDRIPIDGINVFQKDKTKTTSFGVEANALGGLMAGANTTRSTTKTSIYFTEANGDQLMDIVKDGQVYFNHIDTATGAITFTPASAGTPSPIFAGSGISQNLVDQAALEQERQQEIDSDPLHDIVRMWQAPYSGTINVTAPVALLPSNDPERATTPADGVRVAVQLKGTELWSSTIGPDDYSVHQPTGLAGLSVQKGDRLYFRVGSIENGSYDSVNWAPVIDYVGQDGTIADANGKTSYHFDAAKDFILSSAQAVTPPVTGTVHIGGPFVKPVTTDDVTLMIVHTGSGGTNTLWQQTYPHDQAVNTTISLDNIPVSNTDQYSFRVVSPTNIDWTAVSWQPVMTVTSTSQAGVDLTQTTIQAAAVPQCSILPNGLQPSLPYNVVFGDATQHSVTVTPQITIDPLQIASGSGNGTIVFSVKSPGKLLGEVNIPVQNGAVQGGNYALNITAQNGDQLYVEYHVADIGLATAITSASATLGGDLSGAVPAGLWSGVPKNGKDEDIIFGSFYRNWGQFSWNGNRDYATQPIDESQMKPTDQARQKLQQGVDPNALAQQNGNTLDGSTTYDPKQDRFIILSANAGKQRWSGYSQLVFVQGSNMSSSRMGDPDVSPLQINTGSSGTGTPAIDKVSKATGYAFTLGASAGGFGGSASQSTSTSRTLTDFMDLNGDRYPDVVGEQSIQYTNARGGLSDRTTASGTIQETAGSTTGVSLSGSANIPTSIFRRTPSDGQTVDAGNSQTNAGSDKISVSGNAGVVQGSNHSNFAYLDMNGDGLPDRVNQSNHHVALNLGYGFAPEEDWGFDQIQSGSSNSFSGGAGLGLISGNNSFAIGFSLSRSDNQAGQSLQDMNGDGLPDLVTVAPAGNGSQLQVRLNTGNGFSPDVLTWTGASALSNSSSATESGNAAFTFGFPIFFTAKLIFTPSINLGDGMSRELVKMQDVNGDGYPDFVSSSKDDNVSVALSTIGRTNLLKTVTRPMGAYFTLDYKREGNTYAMSNSVWTLSSVRVYDGFGGDGPDTLLTTCRYECGYFDRNEREFYGFRKVYTDAHDAAHHDSVYTTTVQTYSNDNYYTKGMVLDQSGQSADGKNYTQTINTYELKDIITGAALPDSYKTNDAGAAFVALSRTDHRFYEGQPQPGKTTYMTYGYDAVGNVTNYTDFGDEGAQDDISATVVYYNVADKYILSEPKSVTVTGSGKTYRKRESTIDPQTGDVLQIKQYLDDGKTAIHDMSYDGYGNLVSITGPENAKGQRFRKDYVFDDQVHSHIVKVTNIYGYSSEAGYDFRFGTLINSKDENANEITYELDDLGRTVKITGPYEKASGAGYTILFAYHPEAPVPWAKTRHFDPAHPGDDLETVTFIDGLARVLQTKKDGAIFQGAARSDKEQIIVSGRILFDGLGRQAAVYYPTQEDLGTDSVFNPVFDAVPPTRTTYDVLNRVLSVTLPDNSVTEHSYAFGQDRQGQTQFSTHTRDAEGKVSEQFANVRQLITSMKQYTGQGDIWTSFTYDAINQELTTTDAIGATIVSAYDMFGRRISRLHPDEGLTRYSYDLTGNRTGIVTANLQKDSVAIQYNYDFRRVTDILYPKNPENNVHYTYGAPGAPFNRAGKVVVQEDGTGAQEFFYGPLGETVKNIRTVLIPRCEARTFVTQWTYDTWNRLTSMIYPDSEVVSYDYNLGGLLATMKGKKTCQQHNVYVQQLGYDKFEQRVFLAYGNGTTTSYTYEPDRRRLQNMVATASDGHQMMNNVYTYDRMSNILALSNNVAVPQETPVAGKDGGHGDGEGEKKFISEEPMGGPARYAYSYDDLYRLTVASGYFKGAEQETRYGLQMAYNAVGSITRKTQLQEQKEDAAGVGDGNGGGDSNGGGDGHGNGKGNGHGDGSGDGHGQGNNGDGDGYKNDEQGKGKEVQKDSVWEKVRPTSYDFTYNYGPARPHAPIHIGKRSYRYDADGNQTGWRSDLTGECRRMIWDEENRLRAVGGEDEEVSLYRYDAAGSRVLKAETEGESVFVNGDHKGGSESLDNFTVYVSPYLVLRSGDFTKHYFIESQRIASRIGEDWSQKVESKPAGDSIDYKAKLKGLVKGIIRDLQKLEGEREKEHEGPAGKDARGNANSQDLVKEQDLETGTSHGFGERTAAGSGGNAGASTATSSNADGHGEGHDGGGDHKDEGACGFDDHGDGNGDGHGDDHGSGNSQDHVQRPITFLYFYHPDHLGSTSYVTNDSGLVCEHMEYFAFGETFVQEHVNTDLIPYLFNAKELDEKTGFYYYGARYYDPRTSIWESVDPMAEKNSRWSPYAFAGDNPVVMVDPDGRDWFYYQAKNEKEKSWHWQKGHTASYTDTKGKEVTTSKGYENLVIFKETGKNSEGATTGILTVYHQDKVVLPPISAVTGNDNYRGTEPIPVGNYMMNLSLRDAKGPRRLKPDGSNPEAFGGIQKIPDDSKFEYKGQQFPMSPTVTNAYGNGRIRLNQTDEQLNMVPLDQQSAGFYLHGKHDAHNWTHGCVCDKSEGVFNYFWSGDGKNIRGLVPFSVTK